MDPLLKLLGPWTIFALRMLAEGGRIQTEQELELGRRVGAIAR